MDNPCIIQRMECERNLRKTMMVFVSRFHIWDLKKLRLWVQVWEKHSSSLLLCMDYIRNSKNRKLKTQLTIFFSRITFWWKRLDISGKVIIFCNFLLLISVFFPWIHMRFRDDTDVIFSAFSGYTGWIWFGIIFGCLWISFFLFSHEKKERMRSFVPFRLSDAQAIVFIDSMMLTAIIQLIFISLQYTQIAINGVSLGIGFVLALTANLLILVSSFFFSRREKESSISMSYLDKKDRDFLGDYQGIIDGNHSGKKSQDKDKNMTLPF